MLSLAIYTNKSISQQLVDDINKTINPHGDICIFTDNIYEAVNYHTALLTSIFMEFHKGPLVFLDVNEYISYKPRLLSKHIYLYIDNIVDIADSVDRNFLAELKGVLTYRDNIMSVTNL